MQHLSGHVGGILASEEEVGWRDLVGLTGTAQRGILAEFRDLVCGEAGVQIGPGATALTLTPLSASWADSDRVKDTTAPLVEA